MSLDRERKVRAQLERHVERLADTPDLQFQFLPTDLTLSETAAYLLLVASVNQGAGAEAVGKFVQLLWDRLDRQLFRLHRYKREQVDSFVADTRKAAGVNRTRELDDANVLRSATQYLAEA